MRVGYRVRGRVQGVGFRWYTQRAAAGLGLAGWVRNCADGSVEVQVAGPEATLASLRSLLERGPAAGAVTALESIAPARGPLPAEFEIRRDG